MTKGEEVEESSIIKDNEKGWLIDFDFGGKSGKQSYHKGYRRNLDDGTRLGEEGKAITKHHDWYALGMLMFTIHKIPEDAQSSENMLMILRWTLLKEDKCMDKDIDALKVFLRRFSGGETELELRSPFGTAVESGYHW
ncbi:hypothetical protein IV203_023179 [Nitzschia inconspicua]|uniref:Protein kinase domain-containing protein n=1 Tax=Nitzschia inconspicua TaxID=303405 RepID=A0A9K3KCT6_9STRA|nr:hypothetical protein IV203_023179 [Nitzschia inconspicua]